MEAETDGSYITTFEGASGGGSSGIEVSTMIAPAAGESPSDFINLTGHGDDDNLEQNENWIVVGHYDVPIDGTITPITLDIPALNDVYADDGDNPIVETFRRYAQIIPGQGGQLGPVVGQYALQVRLPTSMTTNLAHVCVPGDMNVEAARYIFGLSNILSLATAAISSFGGPILSTALNTANAATGGMVAPLLGMAGSLIPGLEKIGSLMNPQTNTNVTTSAPPVGGDTPMGRFLNFLKPVMVNEAEEPSLPTLLLQVIDFLESSSTTRATTTIPVSVYFRMADTTMERELFDRSVVYEATPPALRITIAEAGDILNNLITVGKIEIAKKLVMTCAENHFSSVKQPTINVLNLSQSDFSQSLIYQYYETLLVRPALIPREGSL